MRTERGLDFELGGKYVLALGCFDGVHLGHRAVLEVAERKAMELGCGLCVFSFEQPPRNFFSPTPVPLITTAEEKLEIFESLGVDVAVCLPLSLGILSMDAERFVEDVILKKLCAAHVVCGYNYGFGKGAAGNSELLRRICSEHGVGVSEVDEYRLGTEALSSSLIRQRIAEGDMESVAAFLDRPYSLTGVVSHGQHLARTLGFPTVNISPQELKVLAKNGVYVTKIHFDGNIWHGITNIGIRPTVDTKIMCVETHIFDFEGDLYGKKITVEFLKFIREERKFPDIDAMSEQIRGDIAMARNYIKDLL